MPTRHAPRRKRSPALAIVMLLVVFSLAIRSLWVDEAVQWRDIETDGRSIIETTSALHTARLGLGFRYEQRITPMRDRHEVERAVSSPGLSYEARPLPDGATLARKFGFAHDQTTDERPESFQNALDVVIPLWLIAILLSIGPLRWLSARLRRRRAATRSDDDPAAQAAPETVAVGRLKMKTAAIVAAAVVGIVIGAVGMSLYWAGRGAGITAASGSAPAAPTDADKPPIHPIVGMWRTKFHMMGATYQFANDGSFVLTFTNVPQQKPEDPKKQEAGGTWRVEGSDLILTNTWSNTPMTVIGEVERATIASVKPTQLELDHLDRKGKVERVTFARAHPFVKGKADNVKIVGRWESGRVTYDMISDGSLEITFPGSPAPKQLGAWSQTGQTLTFQIEPSAAPTRSRRQPHRQEAAEPREVVHDIRQIDDLRMLLHPADAPPNLTITFKRAGQAPH